MMTLTIDPVLFAKALADDTRQEILRHVCCDWRSVSDVVTALGGRVNQPTVSHHLRVLSEASLVHVQQDGRQRLYRLNQAHFNACCGVLVRRFSPEDAVPTNADCG